MIAWLVFINSLFVHLDVVPVNWLLFPVRLRCYGLPVYRFSGLMSSIVRGFFIGISVHLLVNRLRSLSLWINVKINDVVWPVDDSNIVVFLWHWIELACFWLAWKGFERVLTFNGWWGNIHPTRGLDVSEDVACRQINYLLIDVRIRLWSLDRQSNFLDCMWCNLGLMSLWIRRVARYHIFTTRWSLWTLSFVVFLPAVINVGFTELHAILYSFARYLACGFLVPIVYIEHGFGASTMSDRLL